MYPYNPLYPNIDILIPLNHALLPEIQDNNNVVGSL